MKSMIHRIRVRFLLLLLGLLATAPSLTAADWPTYQANYARNGRTTESISADSKLAPSWIYRAPHPPQPAWPQPAKWDSYKYIRGLKSMRNYDPVFHVIVVGQALYFGSSLDDSVHCLDTASGNTRWVFTTDGPVRVAPTYADGKLYFGSDDGYAYCIDAQDGRLVWRYSPKPGERKVLNNGRLISFWPVRTGLIVDRGIAYFGASMLPWKPTYLCAVDAQNGADTGPGRYQVEFTKETMEGPLVASAQHLIAPQGRVPPKIYSRATGESRGALRGGGGSFVLLTDDEEIIHGPGNLTGRMVASQVASRTQLASFDKANAIVVVGTNAYVLTDSALMAMDRKTKKILWSVPCGYSHAMILGGDTLFVGGTDALAAFRTQDGKMIWNSDAKGRVYGLAIARGALYASTDEGAIYCFRPQTAEQLRKHAQRRTASTTTTGQELGNGWSLRAFEHDQDLTRQGISPRAHRWVMHRSKFHNGKQQQPIWPLREAWVEQSGPVELSGQVPGIAEVTRVGNLFALNLDGGRNSIRILKDHRDTVMPSKALTAQSWIRVDREQRYGSIVGVFRDVPGDNRGWMLGFTNQFFLFTVSGLSNKARYSIADDEKFTLGEWYHVAATYDGTVQKLYVNGRLRATGTTAQGDIAYPPDEAPYDIGVYHQKDKELFIKGQLHSVTVDAQAYDAAMVQAAYRQDAKQFYPPVKLQSGPALQFTSRHEAVVQWTTATPTSSILEYDLHGRTWRYEDNKAKTEHRATLSGLMRDRNYYYSIRSPRDKETGFTKEYLCDTYFNYSPASVTAKVSPFAGDPRADELSKTAAEMLRQSNVRRGIAAVIGLDNGALTYEICRQSDLRVIAFDTDPLRIAAARTRWMDAGVYGSRISVMLVQDLSALPAPGHFANLAFSESMICNTPGSVPPGEIYRVMKPGNGVALFGQPAAFMQANAEKLIPKTLDRAGIAYEIVGTEGFWAKVTRPDLPGAGTWTHQYGGPGNSAFGGEALSGAQNVDELEVQWLGEPGARYQDDRSGRNASPLAINGKLFCQGLERILAVDAGNGTVLWSVETPEFMRYNVPRDCSNWCADEQNLYLALLGQCWRIDQQTGAVQTRFPVVEGPRKQWGYDWGFIAREGERLLGSAVKKDTQLKDFWGGFGWYDARGGSGAAKVCSDNLFALYPGSGEQAWTYQNGVILNSTITAVDGQVYFVESRDPTIRDTEERWIHKPELWKDLYLVALDVNTGNKIYEQQLDIVAGNVVFYLASARGKIVIVSSNQSEVKYFVYAFEAATGDFLWQTDFRWMSGDHGGHMSRPAIVGSRLYVRPRVFDLNTGAEIEGLRMAGGGCGTYAATGNAFFFRAGNISMWDVDHSKHTSWSRLRPDCWISTVPALGMVLSPEGGGGCSCGSWMETSAAFMPEQQHSRLLATMRSRPTHDTVQALMTAASADDPQVRVAAIRALGSPRYDEDAGKATKLLLQRAAQGNPAEQTAARGALRLLTSSQVTPTLLSELQESDQPTRIEAIKALGDRGATEARAAVVRAANDSAAQVRLAALDALPKVTLAVHYPQLISWIDQARTDQERAIAVRNVMTASKRFTTVDAKTRPLVDALNQTTSSTTKTNLLAMLGKIGGPVAYQAILSTGRHKEQSVRDAAWNTWLQWPDATAFDALIQAAQSAPNAMYRGKALQGAIHVLRLPGVKRDKDAMLAAHKKAMITATNAAHQKLVLASLAKTRDVESLTYVESFLPSPNIQEDAARALLAIARAVGDNSPTNALSAIANVRGRVKDPILLDESGEVLDHIQRFEDFILQWQIAGPYSDLTSTSQNLIRRPFKPEQPGSKGVNWENWTTEAQPRKVGTLNLAKKFPGTNACVYLRTKLFSPTKRDVTLLIGSDESYKVWLNGRITREHVLEKPRGMRPNQDRTQVTLQEGWNELEVKTVQTGGGWALSCRVRERDGSRLEGLKVALKE